MLQGVDERVYFNPKKTRILKTGKYYSVDYVILSHGSHPCVYLGVSRSHPLAKAGITNLPINVHGGITFAGNNEHLSIELFWFGWDYAHLGDYYYYKSKTMSDNPDDHAWTLDELEKETQSACLEMSCFMDFIEEYEIKRLKGEWK